MALSLMFGIHKLYACLEPTHPRLGRLVLILITLIVFSMFMYSAIEGAVLLARMFRHLLAHGLILLYARYSNQPVVGACMIYVFDVDRMHLLGCHLCGSGGRAVHFTVNELFLGFHAAYISVEL